MGHCLFMRKGETHTAPKIPCILASELAVGSSVYLMEDGVATEYLVVNQGKPSGSSLYDDSCDGLWLLRKNIKENRQWHSSDVNDYANSTIHSYLNSTFLNLFDSDIQSAIQQVKIPYRAGSGYDTTITSGENGLSAKIFLLNATELRLGGTVPANEGANLSYFAECSYNTDEKRVATLNGEATYWWTRTPLCSESKGAANSIVVSNGGNSMSSGCHYESGIRPALVLPFNALFDTNTLIMKGVA